MNIFQNNGNGPVLAKRISMKKQFRSKSSYPFKKEEFILFAIFFALPPQLFSKYRI